MHTRKQFIYRLLPTFIILVALTARLVPGPRTIDDSYITFRYARNILAGNGFVYNPGERVLGTTTPLYAFLLTGIGALTGGDSAPFPQIALIINGIADAASCLLLLVLGRRFRASLGGFGAALAWAVLPFSVTFAIGGLETSLYVLLLTAILFAYLHRHFTLVGLLSALALLTRPDAILLVGLVGVDWLWRLWQQGRQAGAQLLATVSRTIRKPLLAFLIPGIAWLVFATLYFGSPIPHSVMAKTIAYRLPPDAGFIRLLQHYATPFMDYDSLGVAGLGIGIVLYPFLFLIGTLYAIRQDRRAWIIAVYPWIYFAAFAIANPLIFRWYMTPPLATYILLILVGMERLVTSLLTNLFNRRIRGNEQPTQAMIYSSPGLPAGFPMDMAEKKGSKWLRQGIIGLFTMVLPAALLLNAWTLHPDHGLQRPAPGMAWYQLELYYQQASEIVKADAIQQGIAYPVLAAGDVGVLGYYTSAKILDTVGLNSPVTLAYYPLDEHYYVINYAVAPDLIVDQQPDYVVILEVYGRKGLLKDDRFLSSYHLLSKIPNDIYGSDGMLIFARKERPQE